MIEDMDCAQLNPHTQRSHIYSLQAVAAWLKRSPDTATPDEVRRFSSCTSSRAVRASVTAIGSMTGVRFLFRVTLRRHDLAAESGTSRSRRSYRRC